LFSDLVVPLVPANSGPARYEGDRPRFGDRDGYRSGTRGLGETGDKGGAPADYRPSFGVSVACQRVVNAT